MFDASRLRGRLVTLAGLGAALALAGLASASVLGGRPRWLPVLDSTASIQAIEDVGNRVASAARQRRREPSPARLGLLAGSSDLRSGIDPAAFDVGPGRRWLSLFAEGSNASDICALIAIAERGGLRPDVVIVLLSPMALATESRFMADDDAIDLASLRAAVASAAPSRVIAGLAGTIRGLGNRVLPNRTRIKQRFRFDILSARIAWMERADRGVDAAFRGEANPWSPPISFPVEMHASSAYIDTQRDGLRRKAHLDPRNYSAESAQIRRVIATIARLRDRGVAVFVVIPPIHSGLPLRTVPPRHRPQPRNGAYPAPSRRPLRCWTCAICSRTTCSTTSPISIRRAECDSPPSLPRGFAPSCPRASRRSGEPLALEGLSPIGLALRPGCCRARRA